MNKIKSSMERRMNIFSLTWPIFIETALRMLFVNVDVLMMSRYSENAVAGVALAGQIGYFLTVLYMMVSNGTGVVISQFNGARKEKESADAASGSVFIAFIFGIFISLIAAVSARSFLGLFKLEGPVRMYAEEYLLIIGAFSFIPALNSVIFTISRSFGYSRQPMLINMGANILNMAGNYCSIFGPFGLPVLGVKGVAVSTIVSQAVGTIVMILFLHRKGVKIGISRMIRGMKNTAGKILKIGVPSAVEYISFNSAQIVILYIVSFMGTPSMTAYSYARTVMRLIFMFSLSIGNGLQILTGYRVGAGRMKEAYRLVNRGFLFAFFIVLTAASLFAFFRKPVIGLLTDNAEIAAITSALVLMTILLETGRSFNFVFISGLKGAGDVNFPAVLCLLMMWGISVLFSWIFGLVLGMGIAGVWLATCADEWIRGIICMFRWRSRRWESKAVIEAREADPVSA